MGDTSPHTAPDLRTDGHGALHRSDASELGSHRGDRFGKYRLLGRLRVGGMAEIYKAEVLEAEDEPTGEVVALKRILPSFTDEADYVAMFVDEGRLAMRLDHPGIVQTHELGQVDDTLYQALEYLAGRDLGAVLRRTREHSEPIPAALAVHVAMAVCDALDYAHRLCDETGRPLGIVHRDVSPQNILLGFEGDVKLIDFGIAKSSEQRMRTAAGFLKGKHGYLAPEQAMGEEAVPQSDIFSLGIALYEMLTAERLFRGASDFSTLMHVRRAEVPALEERNPNIPEAVREVVHKALARKPRDRFQSALEFREALERAAGEAGLEASRESLSAYVREKFAEAYELELAGETPEVDPPQREETTGLLDAFEDLEPISAVSALLELPDYGDAATPAPTVGSEGDASPVEPESEWAEELETSAVAESASVPPAGLDAIEIADSAPEGQDESFAEVDEEEATPVAPDAQPSDEGGSGPAVDSVQAAPVGAPMDWDDEELSTQIYDPPEHGAAGGGVPPIVGALDPFGQTPLGPPLEQTIVVDDPGKTVPGLHAAPVAQPLMVGLRELGWERVSRRAALGVLAALCAGVAVYLASRPTAGSIHLTTQPADAVVTLDGARVAGSLSPFVLTEIAPEVPHVLAVSRQGYRPWQTQLKLSSGQQLRLPNVKLMALAPPPEPQAEAAVKAEPEPQSQPEPTGPKAPAPETRATAGKASAPAERTRRASVADPMAEVAEAPGPVRKAGPVASPAPVRGLAASSPSSHGDSGVLRINSRPWAKIFVDGKFVGTTPQRSLSLSAGRHNVTLVNPDFELRKVLTLQIAPGQTVTRIENLQ